MGVAYLLVAILLPALVRAGAGLCAPALVGELREVLERTEMHNAYHHRAQEDHEGALHALHASLGQLRGTTPGHRARAWEETVTRHPMRSPARCVVAYERRDETPVAGTPFVGCEAALLDCDRRSMDPWRWLMPRVEFRIFSDLDAHQE